MWDEDLTFLLLFTAKIVWEDDADELIFELSIDGTHCPIEEPRPFSTKWSSHKFGGKPGVDYEIGLKINEDKVLWVSGPHPAAVHDSTIFEKEGLKKRIPIGKMAIADDAYKKHENVSTKNCFDPREIGWFKDRVMARHETFNRRLKVFDCLRTKWRHGIEKHKIAFEAICVITIYELENGSQEGLLDPNPWLIVDIF